MYYAGMWPISPSIQHGFHINGNEILIQSAVKDCEVLFYAFAYDEQAGWLYAKDQSLVMHAEVEVDAGTAVFTVETKDDQGNVSSSEYAGEGKQVVQLSETDRYYRIRLSLKQVTVCKVNHLAINGRFILSTEDVHHLDTGNGFTLHNAQKCKNCVLDDKGFRIESKPDERGARMMEFQTGIDPSEVLGKLLKIRMETDSCEVSVHVFGYHDDQLVEKKKFIESAVVDFEQDVDRLRVLLAVQGSGRVIINEWMIGDYALWSPVTMFPYSIAENSLVESNHPLFALSQYAVDQIYPHFIPVKSVKFDPVNDRIRLCSKLHTCDDANVSLYVSWVNIQGIREIYHYPVNRQLCVQIPEWVKLIEAGYRVESHGWINFQTLELTPLNEIEEPYPLAVASLKEKEQVLLPDNGFAASDLTVCHLTTEEQSKSENRLCRIDHANAYYGIHDQKPDVIVVDEHLFSQQGMYGQFTERLSYLMHAFPTVWWVMDVSSATAYAMNWFKDQFMMVDLLVSTRKLASSHVIAFGDKLSRIDGHSPAKTQICQALGFYLDEKKEPVNRLYTEVTSLEELTLLLSYVKNENPDTLWRIVVDFPVDVEELYNRQYPSGTTVIWKDNLDLYPDMAGFTYQRLIDLPVKGRSS
ncbi:hypothetical protein [Salisediminibacterium beveridgei]|uniref:Uncharacterized protein n=1 Tax=Salisediminibacterium beveridgei TaxID=632773 RepID=A0A1D7QRQ8_9BACI|nr:hypothetical protein [Salisediminibacterium beveridgei]AOM81694.1 hypothetical protein BBEV_0300 [Salisediminibacterium beveridgei]